MSTNKDSVSRERIQKESHRANAGSDFSHTVQKKKELLDVSVSSPDGMQSHGEHEDGCVELKIKGFNRFPGPLAVQSLP